MNWMQNSLVTPAAACASGWPSRGRNRSPSQRARSRVLNLQQSFFGLTDSNAPAANQKAQLAPNPIFECPSDPNSHSDAANCNYFGVLGGGGSPECVDPAPYSGRAMMRNGCLFNNSKITPVSISDGLSNTFAAGESRYMQLKGGGPNFYGTWASSVWLAGTAPSNSSSAYITLAAAIQPINSSPLDPAVAWTLEIQSQLFGSHHPGGCHFLFADGRCHFVKGVTGDPAVWVAVWKKWITKSRSFCSGNSSVLDTIW